MPTPGSRAALGPTGGGHLTEIDLQAGHAPEQTPAVHLELGLTGSPGADATGLLAEGPAPTTQPGQAVAQEGQLHLGLSFLAAGVLGEDVEDHGRPVDGRAAQDLLEVALLGRGQLVVEDDGVGIDGLRQLVEFLGLAPSHEGGRIGVIATLDDAADDVGTGRAHQEGELVEVGLDRFGRRPGEHHSHEDDALAEGAFDQRHGSRTTEFSARLS